MRNDQLITSSKDTGPGEVIADEGLCGMLSHRALSINSIAQKRHDLRSWTEQVQLPSRDHPLPTSTPTCHLRWLDQPPPSPSHRLPGRRGPRSERAARQEETSTHRRPTTATRSQGQYPRSASTREGCDDHHTGHDPALAPSLDCDEVDVSKRASRPPRTHEVDPHTHRAHGALGTRTGDTDESKASSRSSTTRSLAPRSRKHRRTTASRPARTGQPHEEHS